MTLSNPNKTEARPVPIRPDHLARIIVSVSVLASLLAAMFLRALAVLPGRHGVNFEALAMFGALLSITMILSLSGRSNQGAVK